MNKPLESILQTRNALLAYGIGHMVLIVDDQSSSFHLMSELILAVAPEEKILTFDKRSDALGFAAANHLDLVLTDMRSGSGKRFGSFLLEASLGERSELETIWNSDTTID
jgi:DNA-binding NtrC family response regulator